MSGSNTSAAKWADIITLFDFSPPIRKAPLYQTNGTTNTIESANSVICKFTHNLKI